MKGKNFSVLKELGCNKKTHPSFKKYHWVEILFNPDYSALLLKTDKVEEFREDFERAALWYFSYKHYMENYGFRNKTLEEFYRKNFSKKNAPKLTRWEHRAHIREFLKGVEVALWRKKKKTLY